MTLVNPETGEIVEALTSEAAQRLSERITLRLDTIADNYAAVLPMIREAIERQAHVALGYRSPGEYVADRFGNSLAKLGVHVRREVVRELTEAGLSTRAIAPVVGVNNATVYRDRQVAGVADATPEQEADPEPDAPMPTIRPANVVGIDGKRYTAPAPRPAPAKPEPTTTLAADLAEFPDLAHYAETGRADDVPPIATDLRRYRERGELASRLDTLRRSIAVDKAKRDGTYAPTPLPAACPTCGQVLRSKQ